MKLSNEINASYIQMYTYLYMDVIIDNTFFKIIFQQKTMMVPNRLRQKYLQLSALKFGFFKLDFKHLGVPE